MTCLRTKIRVDRRQTNTRAEGRSGPASMLSNGKARRLRAEVGRRVRISYGKFLILAGIAEYRAGSAKVRKSAQLTCVFLRTAPQNHFKESILSTGVTPHPPASRTAEPGAPPRPPCLPTAANADNTAEDGPTRAPQSRR